MKVNIVNKSCFELPKYETSGSAGMDLKADLSRKVEKIGSFALSQNKFIILQPQCRVIIRTGLFIKLPVNHEAQIRPRSGMSFKTGLIVTVGTIDSDYTGEIGVICSNLTDKNITINHGDRIAQLVLNKVGKIDWNNVEFLEETERGSGGFGHTGK